MARLLLLAALVVLAAASLTAAHRRIEKDGTGEETESTRDPIVPPRANFSPTFPSVLHRCSELVHLKPHRSAGEKLDWHRSVFHGVDRATEVDGDLQTQVKLAFIPGGMSVSYAVANQQSTPSSVAYGTTPGSMNMMSQAGEESSYGTLWFYTALMQNLSPSTRYYYQFVGSTTVYSFVTAHAAGVADPFTVLVVGDMGLYNSQNTMQQMNTHLSSTDWFLHIGDLSYADDFYLRTNDTYEGSWNKWSVVEAVLRLCSAVFFWSLFLTFPAFHLSFHFASPGRT
jgi:hypothetical protein